MEGSLKEISSDNKFVRRYPFGALVGLRYLIMDLKSKTCFNLNSIQLFIYFKI